MWENRFADGWQLARSLRLAQQPFSPGQQSGSGLPDLTERSNFSSTTVHVQTETRRGDRGGASCAR
jgi:hypothetical protein